MWWPGGTEPGGSEGEGSSKEPAQNQQLSDLQEQFEQQQTFIAQLKEMLRKTEQSSSVSREKVEEYASTLNEINARAKKSKLRKSEGKRSDTDESSTSTSISKKSTVVTPAKEKINLLRQQLEENRVKLAQRDKNQKGIEEMVNQLKNQLDESQLMINQSQCNLPKIDIKPTFTIESSKEDLLSIIKLKDASIEELTGKVQQLHANVLDLQENVKEKDSVIEARTKAITLLSENLSKKGKNTLDMLDETKEEMRVMQQNFVALETQMNEKISRLKIENSEKETTIGELQITNSQLTEKCNILQDIEERLNRVHFELDTNKQELAQSEIKVIELSKINDDLQIRLSEIEESSKASVAKVEQPTQKIAKRSKSTKKSKTKEEIPEDDLLIAESEKLNTKQSNIDVLDCDETVKLNKQLEEMNKNMIKMKAQHKAKLKELQKKALPPNEVDEKMSNLESENVKMGQRVAELEEEKGNLQLRLVDYESNKEKEYIADLENKIEEQKMEIENHIRTITILECEITNSSTENSSLRTELADLMHIENAQVCSEITSVQLEEQLDKEVSQKKEIQGKYNEIIVEKDALNEKIEELNKEKQELNVKLENYMQENMELIDRLEKLSAEKVSSAESIEIVESLTQQEKLEIEAYQKEFKPDEEQQETSELNESVSKLTEETSELMERIELFTVERREVMDKMDHLNTENQQLASKIEKLESDQINLQLKCDNLNTEKDDLTSILNKLTTENKLLQNKGQPDTSPEIMTKQILEYETLIENQKQQIETLEKELSYKSTEKNRSLNKQLQALKQDHENLLKTHEDLSRNLKQSSEMIHEKDELEAELKSARLLVSALQLKVTESAEEIRNLQSIVEENKNDLIKSTDSIIQLQTELSFKSTKIDSYKNETETLRDLITQLNLQIKHKDDTINTKEETLNLLSPQLSELKSIISENCEQLQHYESEMNRNTSTIEILTQELNELNDKIVETEHIIELKNEEIIQLKSEKQASESRVTTLDNELKEKHDNFSETVKKLKEKCKFLENQIQANSGSLEDLKVPFETKIQEMEKKNNDQMDKMKKIAANLKKKVATCQDLEAKLAEVKENFEKVSKEKDDKQKIINDQNEKLKVEEEKIQVLSYHLNVELSNFELQKTQYKDEIEYLTDKLKQYEIDLSEKQLEVSQLNSESNSETVEILQNRLHSLKINYDAMEAKLQEKDAFIESLETENSKTKDFVSKLEEGLSNIEERRQLLEERAIDFSVQLEAKDSACKEARETEDLLVQRLFALTSHDEMIENKLKHTIAENQTLHDKVKSVLEENDNLLSKLNEISLKLSNNEQDNEKTVHIENENIRLNEVISNLESELRKHQYDFERKLADKNIDIENMESELTSQVEVLNTERKNVLGYCETLKDNLREYSEVEQALNDEIDQLKLQLSNLKSEFNKILRDNQDLTTINANQLIGMQDLENQLTDLRSTTGTVDTQKLMDDIQRLENAIIQKDLDIQNYQRQNMQLQMASFNTATTSNIFDGASLFGDAEPQKDINLLKNQLSESQNKCSNLEKQIVSLTETLNAFKVEFEINREKLIDLTSINCNLRQELAVHKKFEQRLEEELSNQHKLVVRHTAENEVAEIILAAEKNVAEVGTNTEKEAYIKELETKLADVSQQLNKLQNSENLTDDILKLRSELKSSSFITENKKEYSEEELIQKEVSQILSAPITKPPVDITKEELLRKIKALEFMLFNAEQEKDDTLVQCHQFTNELTRLVYEREKLIKDNTDTPVEERKIDLYAIEGEIVVDSPITLETKKELHNLEYSPVHPPQQTNKPIVEDVIEQKIAYICFTDKNEPGTSTFDNSKITKNWGSDDQNIRDSIESQIISTVDTSSEEKQMFKQFELQPTQLPIVDTKPVVEPYADTQTAYLSYPEDTFASEEDGWGWNAEEAKLEAEHRYTVQSVITSPPAQIKIEQLEERINDLELERSRLLEEIKTSQVRSGKLIKKLKELKLKNDHLTLELSQKQSTFGNFDVLDMAIQDELNTQIKNMEKKLKELTDEISKEKSDRENLLKRIDVLTAANERLIELKEKQDSEVQFWQFKNRELTSKLEQLEWDDDSVTKTSTVAYQTDSKIDDTQSGDLNKKIEELNSIVNDLTLDNEEMQCLLEEQRQLRLNAEKALLNVPQQENMKPEHEFIKLEDELRNVQAEILKLNNENRLLENNMRPTHEFIQLEEEIRNLNNVITKLSEERDMIRATKDVELLRLESLILNLNSDLSKMNDKNKLSEENYIQLNSSLELKSNEFQQTIAKLSDENYQFSTNFEQLQLENQSLNQQILSLRSENETTIKQQLENIQFSSQLELEKQNLTQQIVSLKSDMETIIKDQVETTQYEINQLKSKISNVESEKQTLEIALAEKATCVQHLNLNIQQLELEKCALESKIQEILNIQNSNDTNDEKLQQMNDKLMETLTELEHKNKELSLLQTTLNNVRLEFETKLLNTIQQLNQEWSLQVDQRGSDVAESWKLHIDSREVEFSHKEQELTNNLTTLNTKYEMLVIENLELQNNVKSLKAATLDTNKILQQNLNEKDLEVAQLTKQIQQLNIELEQKNIEVTGLTKNEEQLNSELQQKVNEKEFEIAELMQKSQQLNTELQQKIYDKDFELAQLNQQVKTLNLELEAQIHEKTVEMAELTQKLWELSFELEKKSDETLSLREDQTLEIETLKLKYSEKEEKLEALLQIQDSDLQNLRIQLKEYTHRITKDENDKANLQIQLDSKILQCNELESKLKELTQHSEEECSQLTELRQLIETQVLKIEELKTQLYEKSNDYDAIISEFDTLQIKKEKHVTFKDLPPEEAPEHVEEDLSEPVSRAELDLALYMLHQRDVRCEELTVELMQLLEERDTLQLRLSNAIRINEHLRAKPHEKTEDSQLKESPKADRSSGVIPRSKSGSIVLSATGTELATEATEQEIIDEARTEQDKIEIATKMSQLRSIGYRDKTLRDDQEHRHMQQMSVMQQHRDLAAKLPAEAAARLVDASYTLSRDVQSPSKVLLNWLWGRSTPKVNDI